MNKTQGDRGKKMVQFLWELLIKHKIFEPNICKSFSSICYSQQHLKQVNLCNYFNLNLIFLFLNHPSEHHHLPVCLFESPSFPINFTSNNFLTIFFFSFFFFFSSLFTYFLFLIYHYINEGSGRCIDYIFISIILIYFSIYFTKEKKNSVLILYSLETPIYRIQEKTKSI